MPDQELYPVSITEPWPRQRNRWLMVALVLSFAGSVGSVTLDRARLEPLQQYYVSAYTRAHVEWFTGQTAPYDFVTLTPSANLLARAEDLIAHPRSPIGLALSPAAQARGFSGLREVRRPRANTKAVRVWLAKHIYDGQHLLALFPFTRFLLMLLAPAAVIIGSIVDERYRRQLLKGVVRRGPRLVDSYTFNSALLGISWLASLRRRKPALGITFATEAPAPALARIDPRYPKQLWNRIALSRRSENYHVAVMGSSGTGKSILLRQFLRQIAQRGESAMVYDPAREFTSEFYDESRGDVILNPLDRRCPFWSPASELNTNAEALTLAESVFPDGSSPNPFFVQAPRMIFARLIEYEPDAATLASWLAQPAEIDARVAGTEMAQMLAKAAAPQRLGVLASLAMVANSFRLLSAVTRTEDVRCWSAREWAETRQGWVFLTSTSTTRTAQRPLQSLWIDSMILHLMHKSSHRVLRPVWLVLDELASLQRLPQLETALTEARKYQVKIILGFQGQSQVQERYGEKGAETILGQAKTKIYLRTNEPNAAEWISKALGEQDVERVRETRSLQEGIVGRNSQSYARELRTERAVTTAQVLGEEDLQGWIKQENYITHFTLPVVPVIQRVAALEERDLAAFQPLTLDIGIRIPDREAELPTEANAEAAVVPDATIPYDFWVPPPGADTTSADSNPTPDPTTNTPSAP